MDDLRPIPELPHTHDHGAAPIPAGTPISLRELCGVGDPDSFGGFIQYVAEPSHGKFTKPGVDPKRTDLTDADFEERDYIADVHRHVDTLAEAHGIWFDCPECWRKNGGPVGTHGVCIWFTGSPVPPHLGLNNAGQTVRWTVAGGTGLNNLSLTPSILLQGGCNWHGFVGSSGVPPGFAS